MVYTFALPITERGEKKFLNSLKNHLHICTFTDLHIDQKRVRAKASDGRFETATFTKVVSHICTFSHLRISDKFFERLGSKI